MSIKESLFKKAVYYHTFTPRIVDMEVTRACNLKCVGCPRATEQSIAYREEPKGELKHLTIPKLKRIISSIPSVKLINFIGDGEPLVNPYLNLLIGYLHAAKIRVMFTTNGTLIEQGDINLWKWWGNIRNITVSLDSLRPERFEALRPGASYSRVMASLAMLTDAGIPTSLNVVLTKENADEQEDFLDYVKHNRIEKVNFTHPIFAQGSDLEGKPYTRADITPTFRRCLYPFMWPYITLEGDVYACCYMVGENRQEWFMGEAVNVPNDNYKMGNIYQGDFRDIWYGETYKELRKLMKQTELLEGGWTLVADLRRIRRNISNKHRFSYCKVCLYRWGCSC